MAGRLVRPVIGRLKRQACGRVNVLAASAVTALGGSESLMALSKRERTRRARRSKHNTHLKKTYGITIDDYDKLLAAQAGKCAICHGGTSKRHFAVDHNHRNNRIRGLLCARCNTGLSRFMDDITNLRRAVTYMKDDGAKVQRILEDSSLESNDSLGKDSE